MTFEAYYVGSLVWKKSEGGIFEDKAKELFNLIVDVEDILYDWLRWDALSRG